MGTIVICQRVLLALSAFFGLCYLYQTVYLLLPFIPDRRRPEQTGTHRRFAILIAARNEQAVLPWLLDSIRAQDYPAEKVGVFVLADNCTDDTAAAARAGGAVVWERQDAARVGKGYALQALLEHMAAGGYRDRYDAFLVFDADNLLAPDYLRQMDGAFSRGYAAVCGFRSSKNFMQNWITAGYGLWYVHDSAHLNASRARLGVTCACAGTGFGFTRELLARMGGWPFHTLVEDIEFDTWCAINGVRMGYCDRAVVYDEQPATFGQSWIQRTRWVRGGIQVSLRYAGALCRGLFSGGLRERWGRFENLTLTLYGYGGCALTGGLAALATLLAGGPYSVLRGVGLPLAGMVAGLFAMGALTTVQQWRRIPGTAWQKVRSCLTFPFFMLTYIPVAVGALLTRPQWRPVRHTVAVGIGSMPAGRP